MKFQAILEDEETVSFGAMPPAPSRKIFRGSNEGGSAYSSN